MTQFFSQVAEALKTKQACVVARIIRHTGSAPRETGTRCLILEEGGLQGTIGGGLLEFKVLAAARRVLAEGRSLLLPFRLSGEELAGTEMLCGGEVDVYLDPIHPDNRTAIAVFEAAGAAAARGVPGRMVTLVCTGVSAREESVRAFVAADGSWVGNLKSVRDPERSALQHRLEVTRPSLIAAQIAGSDVQLFIEPVDLPDILYLFGAGHISTCIAPLARSVGFRIVVIDDREAFADRCRFPAADDIRVTPFHRAFADIRITPSSYVVIVTRGHRHDGDVLRQALLKTHGYIGMIGSRRKRDTLYRAMMAEGFKPPELERVHCPIGLEIGAQTPEEIAVSIVGELISVRGKRRAGGL